MVVGDQSVTAALVKFPAMRRHSEKLVGITLSYRSARDEDEGDVLGTSTVGSLRQDWRGMLKKRDAICGDGAAAGIGLYVRKLSKIQLPTE